jgi:predicted ribosomally synthesized peptide with SipW-like signal peptide
MSRLQGRDARPRHRKEPTERPLRTPFTRRDAKVALSAVVLAGLAVGMSGTTLALFTDQESTGANTFTTGTINLTVSPTSAVVSFSNMLAGDSTTSSLVVTNAAGSSALRYAISSSATNADSKGLKDQLVFTVKTIDVTTPGTPCDNFDGTQLYTGDLDSTAGKIVGDSAQGAQAGDRALAAGGSETLCLRVSLPSSTGNAFKSAATTATFTFDAEQTANN